MDNRIEEIKLIFSEAYKKKTARQRKDYINKKCGTDADLRAEVESLLKSYDDADGFLDAPVLNADVTLDDSVLSEGPGTVIGRYKLLEKIGEGGMAVVYMAEQEKPIRRKVALKIIKLGMDTKSVIARFEAERQALAMMDHPNIAKVLDAGATETGRPYFVMELVTGISITEYCDKNNLSTKERLVLFIQVCSAVQHAHQKGIIHRDIKPTNVMITRHEGEAIPKVIDFGIAKATNQRLTEKTLFTHYAHIIGTPAYMSPEQADLGDIDVDTRSDIYSLGVLLYELLTGTTPFSEEELCKAGYIEMQRVICEQEPTKPSTKLSTLGETLTDIAKYRRSSPDLLTKALRGDLDWIVLKTLEKARDRRYDTVSALAMDIQRHLKDEPVLARAPSTLYLLHKFLRRHYRIAVAAVVVIIMSGIIITMSLMWSRDRFRFAVVEAARDQDILAQANILLKSSDFKGAIENLETIADSKHVGVEAQTLYYRIVSDVQEKVRSYTDKIDSDPDYADNYLERAQYLHCLDDEQAVLADMERYLSALYPSKGKDSNYQRLHDFLANIWASVPMNLGTNINTSFGEWSPCISRTDGLSLIFISNRATKFQNSELWIAKRASISAPWNMATHLGHPVDGPTLDNFPAISADDLSLYFAWKKPNLGWDLCVSRRATTDDDWGAPVGLGPPVNGTASETRPSISFDGLELFFTSSQSDGFGDTDIYVSRRESTDIPWGEPVNLGRNVNSPSTEGFPSISTDGRLLFFSSFQSKGSGAADIFVTARATKTDNWGPSVNLGPTINSPYNEGSCCISADGLTLYLSSRRPGGQGNIDLWQVSIASTSEAVQKKIDTDTSRTTIQEDNHGKEVVSNESDFSDVSMEEK